ncbi:MAG: hypothetical protein ACU0BB_12430 [Paracoccaceae bacterium]
MFRFISITLVCLPIATSAYSQDSLSAEAFDRYTRGKTLFYGEGGHLYGVERYLPNRRVVWSFLDGRCQDGSWFPEGDQICFVYDDVPTPQCWRFQLGTDGLSAQFEKADGITQLFEAGEVDEEMICHGPDVGV